MSEKSKEKPLVSVVVPAYNVEDYIDECLYSLVNQNIGLEKIEIIVVDDKCSDGSMDIVNKYTEEYPQVVRVITHKKNRGLGAARNTGFAATKGEFVSFVDSDDFIDINTLEFMTRNMKKTNSDIGMYSLEYYSESGERYERNPSAKLFSLNKAIDRYEYVQYPEIVHALSACNKVYKREIIEKSPKFPEGRRYEDGYFSVASYLQARRIYTTDKVAYYYRKRESEGDLSIMDEIGKSPESFIDHAYLNKQLAELKVDNPDLGFALDWLNMRTFYRFGHILLLDRAKRFGLSSQQENILFDEIKPIFSDADPHNSYLDIDREHQVLYDTIHNSETLQEAKAAYSKRVRNSQAKQLLMSISVKAKNGTKKLLSPAYYRDKSRKVTELRNCYMDVRRLSTRAAQVLKDNNGEVWLVSERGEEAKDNGYFLFKYIRDNHPDVGVYFVIDQKAPEEDLKRVQALGNVIYRGTEQHKIYFLAASKLISTHARGLIEPWKYPNTTRVLKDRYWNKKFVFIQHGVILNNLKRVLGKDGTAGNFDLFICGGKPEYDEIASSYGYDKDNVAYTGLARYDTLHNVTTKRQVLLMPTWRLDIVQSSWSLKMEGRTVKDSEFIQSEYYKRYQSLINSPELIKLLKEGDLKLIFYPHFEIQQYLGYFSVPYDANTIIAHKDDYDVNKLLKESKALITDYSSVLFDMAYMNKPTIMYQFDESAFFSSHYPRGYFDYRRDGFGPVVITEEEMVNEIKKAVENNFVLSNEYEKRVKKFFELRDNNNSERIYEEVSKL